MEWTSRGIFRGIGVKTKLLWKLNFCNQVILLSGLTPLLVLIYKAQGGLLSANPIEDFTHVTGWWALSLLCATLAVTPLRLLLKSPNLIYFRKTLGLLSFFYASVHLLIWVAVDQYFAWNAIITDILDRPFVTFGIAAWLLMLPLAVTSRLSVRARVGNLVWKRIHRLIYIIAPLSLIHFILLVKKDMNEPLVFVGVVSLLLLFRVAFWLRHVLQIKSCDK
tara:strand:+ start:93 stop:755 length:663 start_codon:yes stop_codon:yes gene_type:complete